MAEKKGPNKKRTVKADSSSKKAADQEGAVKPRKRAAGPKEAETAQLDVLSSLRLLVDNLQQGILFEGSDRSVLFANQAFCDLFGIPSPAAILGLNCASLAEQVKQVFTDPEAFVKSMERSFAERKTVLSEELALADGRIMERDYIPVAAGSKQPGRYWIYRDVTERRLAESRLQKSESNLKRAEQLGSLGHWEWNILTNELIWSDEVYRLYGLDPRKDKPSYDLVVQNVAPECRDRFTRAVENAVKHGAPFEGEYRGTSPDGTERFTHTVGEVIHDREGRPVIMFGIMQDITQRKRSEERLQAREKQLAESQRIAHIGSWEHNLTTGKVLWSDELFRLLGLDPEKDPADFTMFFNMIHPDDQPALKRATEETVRFGKPFDIEYRFVYRDGTERIIHARAELIHDDTGKENILSGTAQDITERIKAEKTLRESEERLRHAQEVGHVGYIDWDLVTNRVTWSDETFRIYGFTPDEITPTIENTVALVLSEDRGRVRDSLDAALRGDPEYNIEHRMVRKDGAVIWVHAQAKLTRDDHGKAIRLLGSVIDITERKKADEELAISEGRYRSLFEDSPISLWEEDITDLQAHIMTLRSSGITDFGMYFANHPEEVLKCVGLVKIVSVNKATLSMYEAPSQAALLQGLSRVFSAESFEAFQGIVVALAEGALMYECETVNKTLQGRTINVLLRWSLLASDRTNRSRALISIVDMTERMQAEETIRQSETKYRNLFESSTDGIFILDLDGNFIDVNSTAYTRLGYTKEEMLALHISKLDHPAFVSRIPERLTQIREHGFAVFESAHLRKDGTAMPVEVNSRLIAYDGKMMYFSVIRDITERKKAEYALKESERRLRTLVDAIPDAVLFKDTMGRHIIANRANEEIVGLSPEMLLGKTVEDLLPPDEAAICRRNDEEVMKKRTTVRDEEHSTGKNGKPRILDTIKVPLYDDNGAAMGLVGIMRDITERKRTEEELRKNEEALAEAQLIAQVGSLEFDVPLRSARFSSQLMSMLNLDPSAPAPSFEEYVQYVHPDDRTKYLAACERIFGQREPFSLEYRLLLPGGVLKHVQCIGKPSTSAGDGVVKFNAIVQDITERKQAEEKIRESEQFIRGILDTVDEGFIVIDRDYRILTANKTYCSQAGLACDEVIGRHCFEISHRTLQPCYEEGEECAVRMVFETGEPHAALHKHTDREGRVLYVETKGFPIKDAEGNVTSVIETINNITEKHLLEEERLKTQKLESIGTLAGGIAHDFNNLLQGIFGYISVAKMTIDRKDRALAMLQQAENALHQSVNLTTQLLTFSKGGKPVKKPIDIRPVIENAARFTLSGSRSDFHMEIVKDLWNAEADEGQIGQVIQNIVLNADQAMPLGGSVMITAKNVAASSASLPHVLARGNYIMISIEDTGVGIPEQYVGKIFDPYFTTKEKGSGLGLATSYSIVRNHGGMIDVRTKPGEGSTFTVYLPAIAREDRTASSVKPPERSAQRTARVLVMDDEEIIRNLSRELVNALGHEVDIARHGEEALEKYREALAAGKPFDLVILDLTVRGGTGGVETIQKLREIDPAVKAVVSSGYSDDTAIASHLSLGFKSYLKKPYNIDQLRQILNSLLT